MNVIEEAEKEPGDFNNDGAVYSGNDRWSL